MNFYLSGRDRFGFTDAGFFTLVNEKGEPLLSKALPFFQKAFNHLIWIFFWLSLILISRPLLPHHHYTDRLFMVLIFGHLFLLGCRLTSLMLTGGIKPILFPPLWIRLTRQLQKGGGVALLQKYQLDNHPGLLANLALIQYSRGDPAAFSTITRALSNAPDHPILTTLAQAIQK